VLPRVSRVASSLLADGGMPMLRRELGDLMRQRMVPRPPVFDRMIGGRDIPSFVHLALCYGLSLSVRGLAVSRISGTPIYKHAWVRAPSLRFQLESLTAARKSVEPPKWFPWGRILVKAFDPAQPAVRRDKYFASDVLRSLRLRASTVMGDDFSSRLLTTGTRTDTRSPTDAEVVVLDILRDVGVWPRYADTTRPEQLAAGLRALVKAASPALAAPMELISGQLQNRWVRGVELDFRLRFRRDALWDVFDSTGVSEALKSYNNRFLEGDPV